jgi:subtilisin family serine protease
MTSSIKIVVVDPDNRPLQGALVSAGDAAAATDEKGRAELPAAAGAELRAEAAGFAGQGRILRPEDEGRTQRFVLGRPDMPYYYLGRVKVPYEPLPGVVAVLTRSEEPLLTSGAQMLESDAAALAERAAARPLREGGNFARSGIVVLQMPESDDDAVAMDSPLSALTNDPAVEAAGAVVRLGEDHASFLTDEVIARFEDGVDEARVAELAELHGLEPAGRFEALGNVHRLRFAGAATYALLDAANGLAEEEEVVYAEPNLAHTIEEDAVVPTDFLFPEQWDHRLINTPDAWQALRDIDPARTFGDADLVVAVVDSGVDLTHPEFSGTVSSGAAKQVARFNFALMEPNMNDLDGDHGTCCASAALANVNNASVVPGIIEGVAGVAGNCRLIAIRYGGDEARFAAMYLWAGGFDPGSATPGFPAPLARGADIITNSFGSSVGSPISGLMSDTFDRLTNDGRGGRGVLLFFSAGNINRDLDDTNHRPWGMYDRCFCVSASTLANDGVTEVKADYSSFGSTVDWCAPSSDNEGRHNPPGVFGAHTATIIAAPEGDAICGHPARQTTLAAAAAAGATLLSLTSVAGFAVGQAVLAGAPGGGAASGRLVRSVNAVANQIRLDEGLGAALPAGAPVVAGPRAYCTSFGGTSHATPLSAGVAALVLSANPELRWDEVRDGLRATAVKIDPENTDPDGRWRDVNGLTSADPGYLGPNFSEWYGFGRLDAAAAVRSAVQRVEIAIPALV